MWGKMQISSTEGPQVASISSIGKYYTVLEAQWSTLRTLLGERVEYGMQFIGGICHVPDHHPQMR